MKRVITHLNFKIFKIKNMIRYNALGCGSTFSNNSFSQFSIIPDHALRWYDLITKTANAFKRLSYHILNIVCLLYVSTTTLVTILREVHYKGYITKVFEP